MTKRLLLPFACAALTLAAPLSTNPRPRNAMSSFGAYTGNATLFYGVAAEEPPPTDPAPETPPEPPEFVMPQSGSGWLDFIFQYAYVGLSEEESSLLRAVLLPQYERFAAVFQPAPEPVPPAAETAPTVQVALSITSTPLPLTTAPAAPVAASAPLRSIAPLPLNGISESRTLLNSAQENVNVPVTTPEPGALLLFGSGLALLALRRRAG